MGFFPRTVSELVKNIIMYIYTHIIINGLLRYVSE